MNQLFFVKQIAPRFYNLSADADCIIDKDPETNKIDPKNHNILICVIEPVINNIDPVINCDFIGKFLQFIE